jgi:hypothetical protein
MTRASHSDQPNERRRSSSLHLHLRRRARLEVQSADGDGAHSASELGGAASAHPTSFANGTSSASGRKPSVPSKRERMAPELLAIGSDRPEGGGGIQAPTAGSTNAPNVDSSRTKVATDFTNRDA